MADLSLMNTDDFTAEPLMPTSSNMRQKLEAELAAEKQIVEETITSLDEGVNAVAFGPYRLAYEMALEGDASKIEELAPELADLAESLRTIVSLINQLAEEKS